MNKNKNNSNCCAWNSQEELCKITEWIGMVESIASRQQ